MRCHLKTHQIKLFSEQEIQKNKVKGQVKYMIKTILFSVAAVFFVSGIVFIAKDIKEKLGQ